MNLEEKNTVPGNDASVPAKLRKLSLQEAQRFLELQAAAAVSIAGAVALLILSPVCLMCLAAMSQSGYAVSKYAAYAAGITILLLMAAATVLLLIRSRSKSAEFAFLLNEETERDEDTEKLVAERRKNFKNAYNLSNLAGVFLCMVSMLPLGVVLVVSGQNVMNVVAAVCGMLSVIALGVFFMVRAGVIWESFNKLMQEGDYSSKKKAGKSAEEKFRAVYWSAVAVIFLLFCIVTGKWNQSWLIWLTAGILYLVIMEHIEKKKK